jgi:tripartite-type tricarboxylate transporter receptor subunit TctC
MFAALLAAALPSARAQPDQAHRFGDKPVRIIVPFGAGANSDVITRLIAHKVTERGGPKIVVDNRPGGGGVVGALAAKQASADGHTLFAANTGTHALLQFVQKIPYDPLKDFRPITQLFYFPTFLAVPAKLPAASVAELVAYGRGRAEGLIFGSQGIGSSPHILGMQLASAAGLKLQHVPYPAGGAPMNLDLVAGRLDFVFSTYSSLNDHRREGRVKFLAVAGAARSPLAPEIPTTAEAGLAGLESSSWFGLVAPAGTPDAVIATLHGMFTGAAHAPDVVARLQEQAVVVHTQSPAEFAALIERDINRLGTIVKASGARAD